MSSYRETTWRDTPAVNNPQRRQIPEYILDFKQGDHLNILFLSGDDTFPHEEAVGLKELAVLLRFLLALVQQEADYPLLQDITKFPG